MNKKNTEKEIFISTIDIWKSIKKSRKKIFFCMILCALLGGFYQLSKPLHYTSKAIFKTAGNGKDVSGLSNFFENFIEGGDSRKIYSKTDPRSLFYSHIVAESAVNKLGLQVTISDGKEPGLWKRLWNSLSCEYYLYKYRQLRRPNSQVSLGNVTVPDKLFIKDSSPPVSAYDVHYPEEVFSCLKITFLDSERFEAFDKKQKMGEGYLNQPFFWKKSTFTLKKTESANLTRSSFFLTFVPTKDIAQGVINEVSIQKDKENSSFLILSYSHPDRHLASKIVNGLMDGYRDYLEAEAARRSDKQIHYLEERHEYSSKKLESLMALQVKSIEENLEAGELVTIKNEIDFVSEMQASYRKKIQAIAEALQVIDQSLYANDADKSQSNLNSPERISSDPTSTEFLRIIQKAHQLKIKKLQNFSSSSFLDGLNLESAKNLQKDFSLQLSHLDLEIEHYNDLLLMLEKPHFEITSLNNTLADSVIAAILTDYSKLSLQLLDDKNRTAKEIERTEEALKNQRIFLTNHIKKLKELSSGRKDLFKHKLTQIQEALIILYAEEYELIQKELSGLYKRIASLPQKWLLEKKVDFDSQVYTHMIEVIIKMIESKNIALNMEILDSYPVDIAIPATLPNPPRALMFILIGCAGSGFIYVFILATLTTFQGIVCHPKNLKLLGHLFLGEISFNLSSSFYSLDQQTLTTLRNTAHYIFKAKPKIIIITSRKQFQIAELLVEALKNYDLHKVLIINLESLPGQTITKSPLDLTIQRHKDLDEITIENFPFRQEYIHSSIFQKFIEDLKNEWDMIILQKCPDPIDLETEGLIELSDLLLHIATEENYQDLGLLTESTKKIAFLFQEPLPEKEFDKTAAFFKKQKKEILIQLKQIEPMLEALKRRFEKSISHLKK